MSQSIKDFLGGVKFDEDKVRMELLPPEFLTSTASILTFGAQKYSDRNWENGMDWSRVYGALQRHLNAWWGGEHTDPETGKSHLWHANCCMAFLTTYEIRGVGTDDRPVFMKGEDYEQTYTTGLPEQDGESDGCGCNCTETESPAEGGGTHYPR